MGVILVGHGVSKPPPGTVLWHVSGEGKGTPAADGTAVYFLSTKHEIVAINMDDGATKWRQTLAGQGSSTYGSSLVIAGRFVVAGDYDLFAVNRHDGVVAWRFTPTAGYGPGIYLGEAARGLIFAGSPAARLYAVEQDTGRLHWSFDMAGFKATIFEPIATNKVVYAGYTVFGLPNTGGVIALDIDNGRELWRRPCPASRTPGAGSGFAGGLVMSGEVVIGACGDGTIYGVSNANGTVRWTIPGLSPGRSDYRALVTAGETLIAGSLSGVLASYDTTNQKERWRIASDAAVSIGFEISADRQTVFVPYLSGQLEAIDVDTGKRLWGVGDDASRFIGSPLVLSGRIFVNGSSGFYSLQR